MNEELYEYLSEQYMDCVSKEDELIHKKYELQSLQRKFEENLYFHEKDDSKRQLFTPLVLKNDHSLYEISQEQFQLSENGKQLEVCERELKELDKMKRKLKGFIHELTQQSIQFDVYQKKEDDTVSFFPAFYELLEHTDQQFPDVAFHYEKSGFQSHCVMTFGFLITWKKLFSYCSNSLILSSVDFQILNDRDKIMISMKFLSKVPIGKNVIKKIDYILSKEFYLQSWRKDRFEINIILK